MNVSNIIAKINENLPLWSELENLNKNQIYEIIKEFLYDHINTDNYKFKNIFDDSYSEHLNLSYYDNDMKLEEIKYVITFYDCIIIYIGPYQAVINFKQEHKELKTICKLDFEKFYEKYVKKFL